MCSKFNVSVIPNTPDEIKLATQEIIDRVVYKKLTAETDLQKKINNKIENSIKTNTDLRLTPSSIISSNFLEKYKYLI